MLMISSHLNGEDSKHASPIQNAAHAVFVMGCLEYTKPCRFLLTDESKRSEIIVECAYTASCSWSR